jgi:hypothetical protein
MDPLELERDFYINQCNKLGSQVVQLQAELKTLYFSSKKTRLILDLTKKLHELNQTTSSLENLFEQFFIKLFEVLSIDRVALFEHNPQQKCFKALYILGFFNKELPVFYPPSSPPDFIYKNSMTISTPLLDCLCNASESPYILWSYNQEAGMSLLIGSKYEDKYVRLPFGNEDRELIETILLQLIHLIKQKNVQNNYLTAIEQLENQNQLLQKRIEVYEAEHYVKNKIFQDLLLSMKNLILNLTEQEKNSKNNELQLLSEHLTNCINQFETFSETTIVSNHHHTGALFDS